MQCKKDNVTGSVKMTGYVNVTSGDLQALKVAIAKFGPVSVAIDASHKSLSFYANGVYFEPKCGKCYCCIHSALEHLLNIGMRVKILLFLLYILTVYLYYVYVLGSSPDSLDHAVLAVGYGVMNGQPYWLIKNSWSTYWGNNGYVLMSQKGNNCGVATSPTYVLM